MSTDHLVRSHPAGPSYPPRRSSAAVTGSVRHVCPLVDDVVALEGMLRTDRSQTGADPDRMLPSRLLPARAVTFPAVAPEEIDGGSGSWMGFLAVARIDAGDGGGAVVDLGRSTVLFEPERARTVSAEELGWMCLAGAGVGDRDRVTAFLAGAAQGLAGESIPLAHELRRFRNAARESLPHCDIRPELADGLYVDSIHRVGSLGFYLRGWLRAGGAGPVRLTAVAPEGARTELSGNIVRFPRPDVDDFYGDDPAAPATAPKGFLAYFETPTPSILAEGWILEMAGSREELAVEFAAPAVVDDHPTLRTMVLNDLGNIAGSEPAFIGDHVFPCLSALQDHALRTGAVGSVTEHGSVPVEPQVSVIVPLYGRIDFIEHQMAQFVDDPDMTTAELIYVLDSPDLTDELAAIAGPLYRLYGVPFRTVVLTRNLGFAGANAAGASVARAPKLLLLNSDVLPDQPGWLSRLVAFLDETPQAAAVGPKLLYEDGSIQHAGMHFHRDEPSSPWENLHYYKGLDGSFPPANEKRVVPALTGACLLMEREVWDRIGGFKGVYVQGDFEDSDLCLRIADLGYDCWYLPEVQLYHLEGQSYPSALRRLAGRFNAWLHTHLWDERIEALMGRFAEAGGTAGPPIPHQTTRPNAPRSEDQL